MGAMRAIEAGSKKAKKWSELIRQQQESGLSVTAFCREHGFSDQTFYNWRKRLAGSEPVRFALVAADPTAAAEQCKHVMNPSGEYADSTGSFPGASLCP